MSSATQDKFLFDTLPFPVDIVRRFPKMRYMGSKFRLLPWIHSVLRELEFDTVLDGFSGSGCVGYLLKAMGKEVHSTDFLNFASTLAKALIENPGIVVSEADLEMLSQYDPKHQRFIQRTFDGIFFTPDDLRFLDRISWNIRKLKDQYKRAICIAAMIRSCAKRQPRGVFTVSGDPERYKDGRRDLQLSISEHFVENIDSYNLASFDNGRSNLSSRSDIYSANNDVDLVYLDPPYVPRSDDNCYMKRYHFLEGLSCYWTDVEIMENSRVKKIAKPYTPFSYRRTAFGAFESLFARFENSTIVLSYSSNGFPELDVLTRMLSRFKKRIDVHAQEHRYHFGTHSSAQRNKVTEYLVVAR